MNLKTEAIVQRLTTLLEYHQKLVVENKDWKRMNQVARRIKHLTYFLESFTKKASLV